MKGYLISWLGAAGLCTQSVKVEVFFSIKLNISPCYISTNYLGSYMINEVQKAMKDDIQKVKGTLMQI